MKEEPAEQACENARRRLQELWSKWMEEYPDTVDQTLFNLVKNSIETTKTLVRLAAGVKE